MHVHTLTQQQIKLRSPNLANVRSHSCCSELERQRSRSNGHTLWFIAASKDVHGAPIKSSPYNLLLITH